MKKYIAYLLLLAAVTAPAQSIQMLDGSTPHTNNTTTSANINVPSKGWTNVPYATTNYIYVTYGDGLPASATTKLNSDLVWLTNQIALALQLPNQINTNWQAAVGAQSNRINVVIVNIATISNQLSTTMATVASLPGGNLQNGTVNSNKLDTATMDWLNAIGWNEALNGANLQNGTVNSNAFDSATMGWLNTIGTSEALNGVNLQNNTVNSNALDSATLTWLQAAMVRGEAMWFDGGNITSDGSGNATFQSVWARGLNDSGNSGGAAGNYARADGAGNWYWTAWPTTLSYDGGLITSDGAGNLVGTSWRGNLIDAWYGSGTAGYVPVAVGDGTWIWQDGLGGLGNNLTNALYGMGNDLTNDLNQLGANLTNALATVGAGMNGTNGLNGTNGVNGLNGTNGVTPTIAVTNTVTGASGTSAAVTNLGSGSTVILRFTIPQGPAGTNGLNGTNGVNGLNGTNGAPGAAGTNMVTYYNLSNAIVSTVTYYALNTNFNFAASNYLGKFTNIISFSVLGPQYTTPGSGLSPGGIAFVPAFVYWSTNGSSGWTTNLPKAPNVVYAAVTCVSNGLGSVVFTAATHPEAFGLTNSQHGQIATIDDAVLPDSPVSLQQMNNAIAVATANKWTSDGTYYYYGGVKISVPTLLYNAISTPVIDATGTNYQVSILTTNFIAGWQFQVQTNLVQPFYTPANYKLATNSGVATFTVPITSLSQQIGFFRIITPLSGAFVSTDPVQTPYLFLGTNATYLTNSVTHSTNSTLGFGAGLFTCDTNYFYISIGTNNWRRISIPTNTW
jgi:hypothetical protein